MKRRKPHAGFSLLEILAAVIILTVVAAAAVATVAPMRQQADDQTSAQEVATLNGLANIYFLEHGEFPASIAAMRTSGYVAYSTAQDKARYHTLSQKYAYDRATGTFRKALSAPHK